MPADPAAGPDSQTGSADSGPLVHSQQFDRQGQNHDIAVGAGHAGTPDNDEADKLENRSAAELNQEAVPLDMASARAALRSRVAKWTAARAHPHLLPTPNHDDPTRLEQTTLSQLRVGNRACHF